MTEQRTFDTDDVLSRVTRERDEALAAGDQTRAREIQEVLDTLQAQPQVGGRGTVSHPPDALERVRQEHEEAVETGDDARAAEIRLVLQALQGEE